MTRIAVLLVAGLLAGSVAWASDAPPNGTRTSAQVPRSTDVAYPGCCNDADVVDYGHNVNFSAWPDGDELTDQFRPSGLLFGRAINPSIAPTMFVTDPSRGNGCQMVLNGEPQFTGWEYFIFVDPVQNRWATVQRVGADVGYADRLQICFLAAYDRDGNLLDFKYNDRIGFQFLKVERPTADISRVLVGDCDGPFCYEDGGGSAFNCLSYSNPVSTAIPLPSQITQPRAPIVTGVPATGSGGLIVLSLVLGGVGLIAVRWNSRQAAEV